MSSPSLASTTRPSVRRPASAADALSLYIDVIDALSTSAGVDCARDPSARTSVAGAIGAASATQTAKQRRGRRTDERTNDARIYYGLMTGRWLKLLLLLLCTRRRRPTRTGDELSLNPSRIMHLSRRSRGGRRGALSGDLSLYGALGNTLLAPLSPPLSLSLRTTIYRHWITNRFVVNWILFTSAEEAAMYTFLPLSVCLLAG